MDLLSTMEPHWFWLTVGVLMAAVEIVAPGFFMMWLGAAAVLTGVTTWVVPIGVPAQVGLFAILSVIAVYAARKWLIDNPIESEDPKLNDIVTVVEAIEDGHGRVKVGDSVWSAKGRDVATGTKVRVTGADGAVLLVEPA